LASLIIGADDPNGTMAVLASDHIINDEAGFRNLLQHGARVAEETGGIVTLGITPDRPEIGYGYIKTGRPYRGASDIFKVERFTEKPNLETAMDFLATGKYLWNSGMFIWKTGTIRQLISEYMPDLEQGLKIIGQALGKPEYDDVLRREYAKFEKISIDYGIMERAPKVYVLPADIGWDDVGSWTSLERVHAKDDRGNIVVGANVTMIDTDCCIISGEGKLIAAVGIKDLIYVDTPDAVLICPKNRAQDVKLI
jgi:mannose-1-phosphate guanylyltransferase